MISHQYQCIFVEVPKTGSTSIRGILGKPAKAHLNICQIRYELQRHLMAKSSGWRAWLCSKAYFCLPETDRRERGERIFRSYFKFGFVRNPWDRVVSLYHRNGGLQLKNKMSFEQFVSWIRYSSSTCVHALPHTNQLDWLVDPHGNVIVDFIGRFENLTEDWKTIAGKIGAPTRLPHLKYNPRERHYSSYYTDKTKAIIADRFRTDIEYFEYEFETNS